MKVMKCIQIGLLCVQENPDTRPTMATIVSYLNNLSLELLSPQELAFFLRCRLMDPKIVARESSCNQFVNSSILFSINEMSISKIYPRYKLISLLCSYLLLSSRYINKFLVGCTYSCRNPIITKNVDWYQP